VLSLGAKPRGLRPGNNILILFPKRAMCILFYPKFLVGEGTCKGDARCGTHAVPRVTSVNPGACKYNHRNEPREGIFSIRNPTV
jgi:hypothetical protein